MCSLRDLRKLASRINREYRLPEGEHQILAHLAVCPECRRKMNDELRKKGRITCFILNHVPATGSFQLTSVMKSRKTGYA